MELRSLLLLLLASLGCCSAAISPKLVVHEHLKKAYYCGIDPDDASTYHHIPEVYNTSVELVQVQAFIRHGDRMFWGKGDYCWPGQENTVYNCALTHDSFPGTSLDTSIVREGSVFRKRYMLHRNDYKGNCHVGQLTLKGHRQEVINGNTFRRAYVPKLLSEKFLQSEVHFRSDDEPRTILSAESFVQGLFPNAWQPDGQIAIDLYTMDLNRDDMTANPHVCPNYTNNVNEAQQSAEFQHFDHNARNNLYQRISEVYGIDKASITNGARQFDCAFVSACRGSEMPEGVNHELLHDMAADQTFRFYFPIQYPDRITGTKLSAGPILREMYERQLGAQSSVSMFLPKFFLYSGHDTGPIMTLLSALQADRPWVPYASFISVELYRSSSQPDQYYVRAIYNGEIINIPGCEDELCPFDQYEKFITPMIPSRTDCPEMFH